MAEFHPEESATHVVIQRNDLNDIILYLTLSLHSIYMYIAAKTRQVFTYPCNRDVTDK